MSVQVLISTPIVLLIVSCQFFCVCVFWHGRGFDSVFFMYVIFVSVVALPPSFPFMI